LILVLHFSKKPWIIVGFADAGLDASQRVQKSAKAGSEVKMFVDRLKTNSHNSGLG
jgi:hypothetical protein